MNFGKILAAAAIAAGISMVPAAANAKTNVYLGIGVGTPGYYYDPRPVPYYDDYDVGYYRPRYVRRISCALGADILRDRGYRRVHARDCGGWTYSYIGWRRDGRYIVFVNSRNGAVIDRRPAY